MTLDDGLREASKLIKQWTILGNFSTANDNEAENEVETDFEFSENSSITTFTTYTYNTGVTSHNTEARDSFPGWEGMDDSQGPFSHSLGTTTSSSALPVLHEGFVERISSHSSGQNALLRMEAALEAIFHAKLTPDRAAKIISKFMRHAYARISLDKNDIRFYEQELQDIQDDTLDQLDDIQQFILVQKRRIALELEQEFGSRETSLDDDNSTARVEELTQQVAEQKVLQEQLRQSMRQLVHENAKLAVVDPSHQENVDQVQKQLDRLTRYKEQLIGFQAKYKAEVVETQRRLNLYKYARRNRREQRKRCDQYIHRIIQMVQIKLGKQQDGEKLIRAIKRMKKDNEREHYERRKRMPKPTASRSRSSSSKSTSRSNSSIDSVEGDPNHHYSHSNPHRRRSSSSRHGKNHGENELQRRHSTHDAKPYSSSSRSRQKLRKSKTFDETKGVQEANQKWNQSFSSVTPSNSTTKSSAQRNVTFNSECCQENEFQVEESPMGEVGLAATTKQEESPKINPVKVATPKNRGKEEEN